MFVLALALGCGTRNAPESTSAGGYVGVAPAAPLSVPEFSAVNQDGAARSRADLLGHPTVVWYFPAAGTPG